MLPGVTAQNPVYSVLVTDGEERSALAVVRSLGRAGYRVHAGARRADALAASSRWAARVVVTPDPLREAGAFADAVVEYVREEAIDFVVPVTDASMLAMLPARDRLGSSVIPFGTLESFVALADKAGLRERAARLGIAFPRQVELDWSDREQSLAGAVPMPAVIKPARSVAAPGVQGDALADARGEAPGEVQRAGEVTPVTAPVTSKFGIRHAATIDELGAIIRTMPRAAYPLLIQERIVGPGIGVFLLLWDGEILATFAHRRLREKPPSGGVSVYAESIEAPAGLAERSIELLREFGWRGAAMVEYKIDQATGTPYLMEINGRFWGSLQLAIDSGVDFPRLLMDRAAERPVAARSGYRAGVRGRWWWGDVDHLLARLRRSRTALSLPPDAPSRGAAILAFLGACARFDADAVWRWDDPRPFLSETAAWFRRE